MRIGPGFVEPRHPGLSQKKAVQKPLPAKPSPFDPALLRALDFSTWQAVAYRIRKRKPLAPAELDEDGKPKYRWRPVMDAPLTLEQAQDGRNRGFLVQCLRYEPDVEYVLVKAAAGAVETMREPLPSKQSRLRLW
jgi:hypothetical protein